MRRAVYAGSFDPVTNGHMWVIEEGGKLFDELVLAVGTNPDKKYAFSVDERVNLLRRATKHVSGIRVDSLTNQFLFDYANSVKAGYVLRGVRTEGDYEYERGMRHVNSDLCPDITTVFLMPPREIVEVSSSLVKGLVGPEGWEDVVDAYVPGAVYERFLQKFRGGSRKWSCLCGRVGATRDMDKVFGELLALYSRGRRSYHNLTHVIRSLREFDDARRLCKRPAVVEMAVWFHDAIHDPESGKNEEKSAQLARETLKRMGLADSLAAAVHDLILDTRHKEVPRTEEGRLLADIDLSILGRSQTEFGLYERAIREEYENVPAAEFARERGKILKGFLKRRAIYATDMFRNKYEEQARRNLADSLSCLENSSLRAGRKRQARKRS